MITAFQSNTFQNNAWQIDSAVAAAAPDVFPRWGIRIAHFPPVAFAAWMTWAVLSSFYEH